MALLSLSESKARLLNPEGIISCWLLRPGSCAKPAVTPKTQATPTTCKTTLSGEETQHLSSASEPGEDVLALQGGGGLLCKRSAKPQQT